MFKAAVTGEGITMMQCTGQGELFVADNAAEVQILYLENDQISVNGNNVLAFSSSIDWDIHRIQARGAAITGGLYNVSLRGTGYVAITTEGRPGRARRRERPDLRRRAGGRHVDRRRDSMDIRIDTGGLRSMVRGGTGETFQMAFGGQGYVLVQPSESVTEGGHQQSGGNQGGGLGGLLGG